MIIDCISDLHGFYPDLEGGDLLIVAGDLTARDTEKEYDYFWRWSLYQYYEKVVVIAGNHDNFLEENPDFFPRHEDGQFVYLCDSGTKFDGLKIWGSPWTKTFEGMNPRCKAFTVDTDEELQNKYESIPHDIDILITHNPPLGIFDRCSNGNVGSRYLKNLDLHIIKPKLHVFGHIHECGGEMVNTTLTKFVNASIVNERYEHVNNPIRIIL